jgi:hypothetical protein
MAGVMGLLARLRRLEPKAGEVARRLGSLERFDAEVKAGVVAGRFDLLDMPQVAYCVRRWVVQEL